MKTDFIKKTALAVTILLASAATMNAQVRVIDNKGTIKTFTADNGITEATTGTSTTWQLGGTLNQATDINTGANEFSITLDTGGTFLINGIQAETGTAADGAGDATGWTLIVRDQATGEIRNLAATDLIQSGQSIFDAAGTAPAIGSNTVSGLPADASKVSVYRNGAKLIATRDYTVAADALTLLDQSGATGAAAWTLDTANDIIEVHWVK